MPRRTKQKTVEETPAVVEETPAPVVEETPKKTRKSRKPKVVAESEPVEVVEETPVVEESPAPTKTRSVRYFNLVDNVEHFKDRELVRTGSSPQHAAKAFFKSLCSKLKLKEHECVITITEITEGKAHRTYSYTARRFLDPNGGKEIKREGATPYTVLYKSELKAIKSEKPKKETKRRAKKTVDSE